MNENENAASLRRVWLGELRPVTLNDLGCEDFHEYMERVFWHAKCPNRRGIFRSKCGGEFKTHDYGATCTQCGFTIPWSEEGEERGRVFLASLGMKLVE